MVIENLSHIDFSNLINLRQICCNEERHEYNSRYLMRYIRLFVVFLIGR